MRKAVITGATGMIGVALIRRLTKEGCTVYAVVRPNSRRLGNIPKQDNVHIIECDLKNIRELNNLIDEKCDLFFHFAWDGTYGEERNNMDVQIDNIQSAVNAAEAAKNLGCMVFVGAGSQAEYGRCNEKIAPSSKTHPDTGYGIAKLCAGQMTRVVCQKYGIKHIWCRILSVYGPYDGNQTMVMSGIQQMFNGKKPSYTKGEQLWDYLYCDDAANAFYLAATRGLDGSVYCIGSGQTRELKDYIYAIRDAVNPNMEVGIGEIPYFENQVMYLCADISSLTADTGFTPKYSFEEGIKETVEWYRKNETEI